MPQNLFSPSEFLERAPSNVWESKCRRSNFYRLSFSHNKKTMLFPLGCKSRQCPDCSAMWSNIRIAILSEAEQLYPLHGMEAPGLAIGLTCLYDPGFKKWWRAREHFIELIRDFSPQLFKPEGCRKRIWVNKEKRKAKISITTAKKPYKDAQYYNSMEYTQGKGKTKRRLPHSHMILRGVKFIHKSVVKGCWVRAQEQAGFKLIAWNCRVSRIEKGMTAYMHKYIHKAGTEKDEIPPHELWKGRYISYSKSFFPEKVATMKARHDLDTTLNHLDGSRSAYLIAEGVSLPDFVYKATSDFIELDRQLNKPFDPEADKLRAIPAVFELFPDYPTEKAPKWFNTGKPSKEDKERKLSVFEQIYSDLPKFTDLYCEINRLIPQSEEIDFRRYAAQVLWEATG